MSSGEQLAQRVRELAEGSPYVVEVTDDGFDVRLDLADATWHSLMSTQGLSKVFVHHVRVDEERRSMAITDDSRAVTWKAGVGSRDGQLVPSLSGSATRFMGRVIELGGAKVFAWDDKGRYGEVMSYRLSSTEGHALIRTAAADLGLDEHRGGLEMTGLVLGIIGGVGALLAVVVLLVLWLSGASFS